MRDFLHRFSNPNDDRGDIREAVGPSAKMDDGYVGQIRKLIQVNGEGIWVGYIELQYQVFEEIICRPQELFNDWHGIFVAYAHIESLQLGHVYNALHGITAELVQITECSQDRE